jgi:hypothetical protein
MPKLTDRTEETVVTGDHLVHVVDPTDTTDDPAGSSYKATVDNLVKGVGGRVEIETILNPVSGEFDFNNIPQGYRRLVIKGYLASSVSGNGDWVWMFMNEETTETDYFSQNYYHTGNGRVASEDNNCQVFVAIGSSGNGATHGDVSAVIEGYADTKSKIVRSESTTPYITNTETRVWHIGMSHDSLTAAITRLRFRTDNHPTDTLSGRLTLYGEM